MFIKNGDRKMIKFYESGVFRFYADETTTPLSIGKEVTIRIYNGADEIYHEIFCNAPERMLLDIDYFEMADQIMMRQKDSYTIDYLLKNIGAPKKRIDNDLYFDFTDYTGETETLHFRRWGDSSRYYKHMQEV